MIKTGNVVKADSTMAEIRVHRESSCGGNCSHCNGCGNDEIIIKVPNNIGATKGETVRIVMKNTKFISSAILGYGILVIAMILGGILGYIIFENDIISALLSFAFLAVVLLLYKIIFKNKKTEIKIERI